VELTRADSFKRKVQEAGKFNMDFNPEDIFKVNPRSRWPQPTSRATSPVDMGAPPRVLSDQLITIYFQEWAPLFPILHRPSFLTAYEQYVAGEDQEVLGNGHVLAQLYLVFSIASLSSEVFQDSSLYSCNEIALTFLSCGARTTAKHLNKTLSRSSMDGRIPLTPW
jgi:hypothetical protein